MPFDAMDFLIETEPSKPKELPFLPSALIDVALEDLEKVRVSDSFVIDMNNYWHYPVYEDGKCHVCFAGAVMNGTFGVELDKSYDPENFDIETEHRLTALDSLRQGDTFGFLYGCFYAYCISEEEMPRSLEKLGSFYDKELGARKLNDFLSDGPLVLDYESGGHDDFAESASRFADWLRSKGL